MTNSYMGLIAFIFVVALEYSQAMLLQALVSHVIIGLSPALPHCCAPQATYETGLGARLVIVYLNVLFSNYSLGLRTRIFRLQLAL